MNQVREGLMHCMLSKSWHYQDLLDSPPLNFLNPLTTKPHKYDSKRLTTNLGMGGTPSPFWQCLDLESVQHFTPSLTDIRMVLLSKFPLVKMDIQVFSSQVLRVSSCFEHLRRSQTKANSCDDLSEKKSQKMQPK